MAICYTRKRKQHPMFRPFELHGALKTFMKNKKTASRQQVVKAVWDYAKKRGLKEPDKPRILVQGDKGMESLFGHVKSIGIGDVPKMISTYIPNKAEGAKKK